MTPQTRPPLPPPDFVRAQLAWIEANLASPATSPEARERWLRWRDSTRTYLPEEGT